MTGGSRAWGRLRHLVGMWGEVVAQVPPGQLDRWLAARLKKERSFGRRDRRWYGDVLFACVRQAPLAAFAVWREREARGAGMGDALAAWQKAAPEPVDVWRAVGGVAGEEMVRLAVAAALQGRALGAAAGGFAVEGADDLAALTAPEGARLAALLAELAAEGSAAARCTAAGIPLWYAAPLAARAEASPGFDLAGFLAAQATRPPLWLRLNTPGAEGELRAVLPDIVVDGQAVRVGGAQNVQTLPVFEAGGFEVQDLASQRLGAAVGAEPGMTVWDACAGGGGKTMQIAAALAGRGAVYASDVRGYKLDEVRRRAERAGFRNVRTLALDAASPATFDRVLVDAPCSSSGTWRRAPDARFRLGGAGLAELAQLQRSILDRVHGRVAPGGRLVYGTCSWLVEENEAVLAGFVAAHPEWRIARAELVGAPREDADTMFLAVLERG